MRITRVAILFLTAVFLAFGQLDPNTITINASQSVIVTPDQALFSVSVTSDMNTGLDQVVAALRGAGISASNFSTVYGQSDQRDQSIAPTGNLQWYFTLLAPFTKMANIADTLTKLQGTIGQQNSGLTLASSLSYLQVSPELQSKSCSLSDLMAQARQQAQILADAAGLAVGPIVALSDGSGGGSLLIGVAGSSPVYRAFGFSFLTPPPPPVRCSLLVEFKLLRSQ